MRTDRFRYQRSRRFNVVEGDQRFHVRFFGCRSHSLRIFDLQINVHCSISESPEDLAVIRAGRARMAGVQEEPDLSPGSPTKFGYLRARLD
jgi:hypothetical protein